MSKPAPNLRRKPAMKAVLVITIILSCVYSGAVYSASDDAFAGKLTDYRIKDQHTIVVRCDAVRIVSMSASTAQLFKVKDEIVVYPHIAQTSMKYDSPPANGTDPSYLEFKFSQYSFEPGEDYELRFSGSY